MAPSLGVKRRTVLSPWKILGTAISASPLISLLCCKGSWLPTVRSTTDHGQSLQSPLPTHNVHWIRCVQMTRYRSPLQKNATSMNIVYIFTGVNTSYPGVRNRQNGRHQTRPDQIRPMCGFETVVNVFKSRHVIDTGLDNVNPHEGYIICKRFALRPHVCIHIPRRGE